MSSAVASRVDGPQEVLGEEMNGVGGPIGPGGLILFPGAGGNCDHQALQALEEGLDIPVGRVDFGYRIKAGTKRRPPDRMPKLVVDVQSAAKRFSEEWQVAPETLLFGGRSLGGRACSVAVAEGLAAAGLVLLSYPLHPPKKPEKLRVDHFGSISCPVLVVQGIRDPFGSQEEFSEHLPAIKGPVNQCWVDGNHDPKPAVYPEIVDAVSRWLSE